MTIKIDFDKFDDKLSKLIRESKDLQEDLLDELATKAANLIKVRTRTKGVDKDGKKFTEYSDGYRKQRANRGVSPPGKVTLTSPGQRKRQGSGKKKGSLKGNRQGGQMLNSITITEKTSDKRVITAARRIERTKLERHVKGSGKLPVRNPMGFTEKEENQLTKSSLLKYVKAIQKFGRR